MKKDPAEASPRLDGRHILFLQGPSSRFFLHAAEACVALGAKVARLCLCPGDRLYWSARFGAAIHYRGNPSLFRDYLSSVVEEMGITDIVMLGDGRIYHAEAIALLKETRAAVPWIVEHGYLRPDLILVETSGTGGKSDARERFLGSSDIVTSTLPTAEFPSSFLRYALLDIGFHLSNLLLSWFTHPQYQHHALDGPVREYYGWAMKGLRYPVRYRRTAYNLARIASYEGKLFLFPLQLATDYQIRLQGNGKSLQSTAHDILESFARSAPKEALLVVKEHPLDNGLFDWNRFVGEQASRFGIVDRVVFIAGGDLEALLLRSEGVITVNSTVGLSAIKLGKPCCVLGSAVYKLAGLVDEQPLDDFWSSPAAPEPDVRDRFVAFLRREVHVEGGFDGPAAVICAHHLAAWIAERKGTACV